MIDPKFRDLDLCDPASFRDAWPMYDHLREHDPVYWDPHNEVWYIFDYDDIVEISKNPEVFTSTEGNRPKSPPNPSMIHQDGVQHTKQRNLVAKAFTPRSMREYAPKCEQIVEELLAEIPVGVPVDAVERFAAPLPAILISDLIGAPRAKLPFLREMTAIMVVGGQGPEYVSDEVNEAFDVFVAHHTEMVAEREGRTDGKDILSVWMNAEIEGEKLDESQLLFEHVLLFVGGLETTRNAIAGGIEQLALHPEQWAYLREHVDDDAVLDTAIEEMVRYTTPFTSMFRTATRDVTLRGKTILAGQQVGLMYPAANRDPRVFPEPHRFDVRRDPKEQRHLAFGHGSHMCIGRNLARLEMRSAFRALLSRFASVELAPDGRRAWLDSSFLRGPEHLDVIFRAA